MKQIDGYEVLEEIEDMLVNAGCLLYNGVDHTEIDNNRLLIKYGNQWFVVIVEKGDKE